MRRMFVFVGFLVGVLKINTVTCWSHKTNFHAEKISATNNASITSNELGVELDVISALNLHSQLRGVNQIVGRNPGISAWRFHSAFDHVQVPQQIVQAMLLQWPEHGTNNNISFHFVLRQHKKTIATLISINSPGKMSPWLRLTSNLKNGQQLILFYHILEDAKLHQTAFVLPRIQNWTQILLSVNDANVQLFIDCQLPIRMNLVGTINLNFPKDSLMYFRQEPGFKKKFLGAVETAKVYSYFIPNRPWLCSDKF